MKGIGKEYVFSIQSLSMKGIIKENLFLMLMPSHSHRVTFGHIELHLPIGFPLL